MKLAGLLAALGISCSKPQQHAADEGITGTVRGRVVKLSHVDLSKTTAKQVWYTEFYVEPEDVTPPEKTKELSVERSKFQLQGKVDAFKKGDRVELKLDADRSWDTQFPIHVLSYKVL